MGKKKDGATERLQFLLTTRVIPVDQVPVALQMAGVDLAEELPGLACSQTHDDSGPGYVYVGITGLGTKIGFSRQVADRVATLMMRPVLLIRNALIAHEHALHRVFDSERVAGQREHFHGPRLAAFVAAATDLSGCRFGEFFEARYVARNVRDRGQVPRFSPPIALCGYFDEREQIKLDFKLRTGLQPYQPEYEGA